MTQSNNILLIDKPKGITSFDVIRILRKKLGVKKMGHSGTLDPNATGLIVVGVGKKTKKLKHYIGLDKVYEAQVLLGIQTDTGDVDGKVIDNADVPKLSKERVKKVLQSLVDNIDLPVPRYSAVKKQGKPLYKYAREGKEIAPPVKTMNVYWIILKELTKETISIEVKVSSGTYIRSIAEEIGKRLGTVATLKNLRRTAIGRLVVEDAERL